jgi:hypothetical protein
MLYGLTGRRAYVMRFLPNSFEFIPTTTGPPKCIRHSDVRYLLSRASRQAIEIITLKSKDYFIKFDEKDFPRLLTALQETRFKHLELSAVTGDRIDIGEYQKKWLIREISTFDYLMRLNFFSGRSYHDISCYPIIPCLLKNFDDFSSITDFTRLNIVNPSQYINPLRQAFCNGSAVIPDFFFDFAIVQDSELPKWASSRFEFTYNARKLLESDTVSKNLSKWIDRVFGVKSPDSADTLRLFTRPHPPRGPVEASPLSNYQLKVSAPIQYAKLFIVKGEVATIGLICGDMQASFIHIDVNAACPRHAVEALGPLECRSDDLVVGAGQYMFCFSRAESKVVVVTEASRIKRFGLFSTTRIMAGYGRSILFCPDPSSVVLCSLVGASPVLTAVCYSEKDIVFLAANRVFQILAVATIDGFVRIYDMGNGALLTNFETKRDIHEILITQAWGFVVAFSDQEIFLFSVNGEFIKSQVTDVQIVKAFTHITMGRFDFLSFATAGNEIGVFEAMFPEGMQIIGKENSEIASIIHILRRRVFIVFLASGMVRLQPWGVDFL